MTNIPFLPHIKLRRHEAATIHFIVCVTDKGMPDWSPKRVIVTVVPK